MQRILAMKSTNNISEFLNPHISVDCVIFGFDFWELKVLLIERGQWHRLQNGKKAFKSFFALPGNLIRDDENLDSSAKRVLKELTGLENIFLQQFYAFGNPERVKQKDDLEWLEQMRAEPKARVITIGYYALVKLENYKPTPSSFAKKSEWVPLSKVKKLAFDHNEILNKALDTLKHKIHSEPIGFELLPKKFTLTQLQKLYEAVLGINFDKRNFRRKILQSDLLISLREKQEGVSHKRPQLFKFKR